MKKLLLLYIFFFLLKTSDAQTTISTSYVTNTIYFNTGSTYITFAIRNNNSFPIVLNNLTTLQADLYRDNAYELWYSTTSLFGAPTVAAPTWVLATSSLTTFNTNTYDYVTPFDCIGVTIPANTTYRFAIKSNKGTCIAGGVTPNIFSGGGVDLLVGDNTSLGGPVGYFGWTNIGNSGTNYFYDGSISFSTTTAFTDVAVRSIQFPNGSCNTTSNNVGVQVCNKSPKSLLLSTTPITASATITGPNGTSSASVLFNSGQLAPCACTTALVSANMNGQGNYTVTGSVSITGASDINLANNTFVDSIRNYSSMTNGNQTICQFANPNGFNGFSSSGCTTSQSKRYTVNGALNLPIQPDGSSDATASLFATATLPQLPDGATITGGYLYIENLIANNGTGTLSNQARFNLYGPAPNNQANPFMPGLAGNPLNFSVLNFEYKVPLTPAVLNNMYSALGVGGAFSVGYWESVNNSAVNDITLNAQTFPTTIKILIDYVINPIPKWYTTASGGTSIYNSTPFNPFIVAGSGITNTNNIASVTYYASCSADTTCRVPVTLSVLASPVANQDTLQVCEYPPSSSTGTFDLTPIINNVSNNNPSATVTFYQDPGLTVPIANISNLISPSTVIYSKVTLTSGCYATDSVVLIVHILPQFAQDPYNVTLCAPATVNVADSISLFSVSPPGTDTLYYEDAACTQIHPNPHAINVSDTVWIVFKTNTQPFCTDTAVAYVNLLYPNGSIANQDTTFDVSVCTNVSLYNYYISDNSTADMMTSACQKLVKITDNNNNNISLGATDVEQTIDCNILYHNGQPYLNRHYKITPTNQDSAVVCLYFLEDDLQLFNNEATNNGWPAMDPFTNLVVSKVDNGDITDPGHTAIAIPNASITPSFDAVNNVWTICFPVSGFSYFYIHTANPFNTPLPVDLLSFKGVKDGEKVRLNWQIGSSENGDYFEIRRGRDSKFMNTLSEKIPLRYEQGLLQKNYQWIDETPLMGSNHYQLRSTDIDGLYSDSREVEIYFGEEGQLNVYPNPAHSLLNMDMLMTRSTEVIIELSDATGRKVRTMQSQLKEGENHLQWDISSLNSGIYLLKISNGKGWNVVHQVRKN